MNTEKLIRAVGARLRAAREAKGQTMPGGSLSQEALGHALGVTQSAVGKWETTGGITISNLFLAADFLGTTAVELMGGSAPSRNTPEPSKPIDVKALSNALIAFRDAGGNSKDDMSDEVHARSMAALYRLALDLRGMGTADEDAVRILTDDVPRVITIVSLDVPPLP